MHVGRLCHTAILPRVPEPLPVATTDRVDAAQSRDFQMVLVAYRSRPLVETLLGSLPPDLSVVVVDNAHGVDGIAELAAQRPATTYVDGPGRGFAAGANRGVEHCTADYVLFVNPDCSPTVEQLESLVADLRRDPGLAAVSATTVLPDGSVEIGVGGWEPSVGRALVHAVGAHKIFPPAGLWARPVPNRPIEVDWISGACMAVPRQVFRDVGCFDESFFVYNEDVAFGRQVRAAGLRVAIRTDLLVPHLGGGSGSGRTKMAQQRSASLVQYFRRYHNVVEVAVVRVAMSIGLGARSLLCRLRGKDGLAKEHRAYVVGLWRGAPDLT
jgi:GT2 family glycosyltransferase